MANKKVWAYGKNAINEFIKDSLDRNRMFFIWEALKLKRDKPNEYNSITFWSTQKEEENRSRMTTVKLGFFRYIKNTNGNTYTGDENSLSHSIAILALSRLTEFNFTVGEEKFSIKPKEVQIDELKVQFENGNQYSPDLICRFEEPINYFEKWGNKLAIEVKINDPSKIDDPNEKIKYKDFEDHNFPVIEITLKENMQFLKELRKQPFDENDLEAYYNFIFAKFTENIFGTIKSNPVSVKYHKRKIKELSDDIENLNTENKELEKVNRDNLDKMGSLSYKLTNLEKTKNSLKHENNLLKNKSFFTKLTELFMSKP